MTIDELVTFGMINPKDVTDGKKRSLPVEEIIFDSNNEVLCRICRSHVYHPTEENADKESRVFKLSEFLPNGNLSEFPQNGDPLIESPCRCSGHVHEMCMAMWLRKKGSLECEVCEETVLVEKVYKDLAPASPEFFPLFHFLFWKVAGVLFQVFSVISLIALLNSLSLISVHLVLFLVAHTLKETRGSLEGLDWSSKYVLGCALVYASKNTILYLLGVFCAVNSKDGKKQPAIKKSKLEKLEKEDAAAAQKQDPGSRTSSFGNFAFPKSSLTSEETCRLVKTVLFEEDTLYYQGPDAEIALLQKTAKILPVVETLLMQSRNPFILHFHILLVFPLCVVLGYFFFLFFPQVAARTLSSCHTHLSIQRFLQPTVERIVQFVGRKAPFSLHPWLVEVLTTADNLKITCYTFFGFLGYLPAQSILRDNQIWGVLKLCATNIFGVFFIIIVLAGMHRYSSARAAARVKKKKMPKSLLKQTLKHARVSVYRNLILLYKAYLVAVLEVVYVYILVGAQAVIWMEKVGLSLHARWVPGSETVKKLTSIFLVWIFGWIVIMITEKLLTATAKSMRGGMAYWLVPQRASNVERTAKENLVYSAKNQALLFFAASLILLGVFFPLFAAARISRGVFACTKEVAESWSTHKGIWSTHWPSMHIICALLVFVCKYFPVIISMLLFFPKFLFGKCVGYLRLRSLIYNEPVPRTALAEHLTYLPCLDTVNYRREDVENRKTFQVTDEEKKYYLEKDATEKENKPDEEWCMGHAILDRIFNGCLNLNIPVPGSEEAENIRNRKEEGAESETLLSRAELLYSPSYSLYYTPPFLRLRVLCCFLSFCLPYLIGALVFISVSSILGAVFHALLGKRSEGSGHFLVHLVVGCSSILCVYNMGTGIERHVRLRKRRKCTVAKYIVLNVSAFCSFFCGQILLCLVHMCAVPAVSYVFIRACSFMLGDFLVPEVLSRSSTHICLMDAETCRVGLCIVFSSCLIIFGPVWFLYFSGYTCLLFLYGITGSLLFSDYSRFGRFLSQLLISFFPFAVLFTYRFLYLILSSAMEVRETLHTRKYLERLKMLPYARGSKRAN